MRISVRNLRILAAIALGAAVIWATAPYATSYVSSQAVVNAPLNTVLSPIKGQITRHSPSAGTEIPSSAPLVAIEIKMRDHRYLEDLQARLALLDESLAAMQGVLSQRIRNYRIRTLERLAAGKREAAAALVAAEAARDNSALTLQRAETLVRQGHATVKRVDADYAAHSEAVDEVSRLRARLERANIELAAAEAGTFVQDGWNDDPYSQQRLDEVALLLAGLSSEHRRTASERAALDRQIAAERQLIIEQETFTPAAPSAGVIWRQCGSVGETVVPGDVLIQMVDCDARFLEVTLAERHFGDIAPRDIALVRFKGGGEAVSARVTAVLGAGAKFDHPRLAASVTEAKPDQLRVLISLRGAGVDGEPGAFCNVGRTAEVRFERRDLGALRGIARSAGAQLLSLFASADALALSLQMIGTIFRNQPAPAPVRPAADPDKPLARLIAEIAARAHDLSVWEADALAEHRKISSGSGDGKAA